MVEVNSLVEYEKEDGSFKTIVEKVESEYISYRLIPDRMIENGKQIEEFLKTISAMKKPDVMFDIKEKKVTVDKTLPLYYEIMIDKGNITFNYIIPEKYDKVVTNKLKRTFSTATVMKQDDYFYRFKDKYCCNFVQKKHFMFSLNTDYRENGYIEGVLGLVNSINKEDTVLIQLGIEPLNDTWKTKWNHTYEKAKEGKPIEINHNVIDLILGAGNKIIDSSFSIMDMVMGVNGTTNSYDRKPSSGRGSTHTGYDRGMPEGRPYGMEPPRSSPYAGSRGSKEKTYVKMSNPTVQKINYDGFNVQIRLYCDNQQNMYSYSKMLHGVFKILEDDQEISIGKIRKNKTEKREMENLINKQVFSSKEIAVFLQQPNRRMQREFKESLTSIDSVETSIPEELLKKGIPIGKVKYKGEEFMTYWPTGISMAAMHKVIAGLQRTGKSSYLANFAVEAVMKGDSVIIVDTIKNCELANDVRDHMPSQYADKIVVLDFTDLDHLIPLAWNEITSNSDGTTRDKLLKASYIAGNFEYFLETVGEMKSEQTKLSPRMKRYLSCACKVVFSIDGTNIKDVIDCLMYHDIREDFILKSGIDQNTPTVMELRRLDDVDKNGNIITKYTEISGIIDRASLLFNDYMMELLLATPNNNLIDFKYWADNGYCVLLKMSELAFSRPTLKTLVTLIYSKIWLSMIARGEKDTASHRLTHVILDEIHNFPQVCDMLKLNCREAAKYGLSYVFTSHLLIDLKSLLPFIKGSGSNFMLFKTTTENFRLLEKDLELGGFALEDCMAVKDFHTLNIVNYNRDYSVFMSKVVDPIGQRFKKLDRSYLDLEHGKKYGVEYKE